MSITGFVSALRDSRGSEGIKEKFLLKNTARDEAGNVLLEISWKSREEGL